MVDSMVQMLVSIIPPSLAGHMHIIIALFETPLCCLGFNYNAQAYGLMPVLAEMVAVAGVTKAQMAAALLTTFSMGIFVNPITASLYLGCGLSGVEQPDHFRYSIKVYVLIGLAMLAFGVLIGVIPL